MIQDMVQNIKNYGMYEPLISNPRFIMGIESNLITDSNWYDHINSVVNILRDGIELEEVQQMFIRVHFTDNYVDLSLIDYMFNLFMWKLIVVTGDKIEDINLFWSNRGGLTQDLIKEYIDIQFIKRCKYTLSNIQLNQIINDCLEAYKNVDIFSMYLMNTINIKDDIDLMHISNTFWDFIHMDLSNIPLEDNKDEGMRRTNKAIDVILEHPEHCLSDSFRAEQGINKRQYKEFNGHIGTKPDGDGGIFPIQINQSFMNGGTNNLSYMVIDSSIGRTAQKLSKNNVASSGHFARLIGLNNLDNFINEDPHYSCNTRNFMKIVIKNEKMLSSFDGQYYRFSPNGIEYRCNETDYNLVGQTLYFRSPMTCASAAAGHGICYKCYGDLAYTNQDINIGKISGEIITSKLTQKLLSAKHLLESSAKRLTWMEGFSSIFSIEFNIIHIIQDELLYKHTLMINVDDIDKEDEIDDVELNDFVKAFSVLTPKGEILPMGIDSDDDHHVYYLSGRFADVIKSEKYLIDDTHMIPFDVLKNMDLFSISIDNDELSETLNRIKSIINNMTTIKGKSKDEVLQMLLEVMIEGGVRTSAIHPQVILSNQITAEDDWLGKPDWTAPYARYMMHTLNSALTNNPHIVIRLNYQKLDKVLYDPGSFAARQSSVMDLYFMLQPQRFMSRYLSEYPEDEGVNDDKIIDAFVKCDVDTNERTD